MQKKLIILVIVVAVFILVLFFALNNVFYKTGFKTAKLEYRNLQLSMPESYVFCDNKETNIFYPGIAAYVYRNGDCSRFQEGRDIKVFIYNTQERAPSFFLGDKSPLPLLTLKRQSDTPKKYEKNGQEIYEVYFTDSHELVLAKLMGDRIAVILSQNTFVKDENSVRKIMASLSNIDVEAAKSVPYYTYINKKYGVSFEIPPTLVVNFSDERSANIGDESGFWQIIFYADPAPASLDDWLKENSANYTKVDDLTLGGQKAYKLLQTGPGEVTNQEYAIITIKEDYFYRILYRYLNDEELAHLFESFRFTK